jgi:cytochrome c oxidase subunit 3
MLIALAAILMFFMALISAWTVRRGFPNTDWQPILLPRILWLNTLILLVSSATLAFSRHCLVVGRDSDHRHWWRITTILGMLFLAGQLLAWRQMFAAGLFLATSPNSSFFYVFTTAHGLHILGGIAALPFVAFHTSRRLARETATRVVAMYWHFLCALWVVVFALLVLQG